MSNFEAIVKDAVAWRHDFHAHPELLYDVFRTSDRVASLLTEFGCDEVVRNIGRTGVVGVIHGRERTSGKTIGLRADMDALPIEELTGKPYRSTNPGVMHACGHDGHTAMLLGAARHLAQSRNFDGTAVMIFQPAEENGGAGAKAMIDDGLMTRFGIANIFGMHNSPGLAAGNFALRAGPMLASSMRFEITIRGRGGHAGRPHMCIDPIVPAGAIISAMQTLVSRIANPVYPIVVSITKLNAGSTFNVIPDEAYIAGTVRSHDMPTREIVLDRMRNMVDSIAAAHGATAGINMMEGYPITRNDPDCARLAGEIAGEVVGEARVDTDVLPSTGAEDFSFMLMERPGAMIWIGNGDSAALHNARFDFNDEILPVGIKYWVTLCERMLRA